MKRLHVHITVADLAESVRFYATLFATEPSVTRQDYAKWMLDDPRMNFAISARGAAKPGVEHLGIQVEDEAELADVYARLSQAGRPVHEEQATTCCYARSDKQWITDPQGVAWETFLTHGEAPVYGPIGTAGNLTHEETSEQKTEAWSCCATLDSGTSDACCEPSEVVP